MVRLPNYVAGQLNRPAASKINELAPKDQDVTVVGYNELAPIVYGEQLVSGPVIAGPVEHNNTLVYAIAVSYVGEVPIERYTGILINGKREADPPVITTNPAAFSRGGLSIRLYDGTQTTSDATLRAAFGSEYEDVFPNISYAVISIPASQSATLDFANAVKFIVRGKKCWDPRIDQFVWTENPSLHLADYVTEGFHGFRKEINGVVECADWNDSLYNGLPRVRSGVVINEALKENDVLDLFSAYAECLWSYDGERIRIIPDAPVTEPIDTIEARSIREKTLTFSTTNLEQMPTAVSVFFSDRESEEWGSLPGYAQSTEHEIYGAAASKSDVQLLGIYRRIEGDRRAWQRLKRLQTPGRVSWQMYSEGVQYQAGDVVRLPNIRGLDNLDVRLMSQPEMLAPGTYQMHAEIYRSDHYPESGGGVVPPAGVMYLFDGTALPVGHSFIDTPASVPIRGATTSGQKAPSGQTPSGVITVSLQATPNHTGSSPLPTPSLTNIQRPSPPYLDPVPYFLAFGVEPAGEHGHSASVGLAGFANSDAVVKQQFRLAEKTEITSIYLPEGALVFATSPILKEGFSLKSKGKNRVLAVGQNVGASGGSTSFIISSTSGGIHNHARDFSSSFFSRGFDDMEYQHSNNSGNHDHKLSGSVSQTLRAKKILAYKVTNSKALVPNGAILGWGTGPAPEGWGLCDGTNGTQDLTDLFLSITDDVAQVGDMLWEENKLTVSFPTSSASFAGAHNHKLNIVRRKGLYGGWGSMHEETVQDHTHSVSGGATKAFNYVPPHYGLRFIQYLGE